ncbi:PAS domain-containing protein [Natrarchaeobaculum sulfurireducens]|uniref:PAS domain-containing protein n=1 Tax=Natrarchaeobaculum sulfurireducens TaxID=2044521 RepID=UPI000E3B6FB2|nr:PAS domain-containing protein [Natrarchaeobaculum sulfurireducens]
MSERTESPNGGFWEPEGGCRAAWNESLVDAIDGGVFQLDADDRMLAVDDALLELTGFDREDLVGDPVSRLLGESGSNRLDRAIGSANRTGDETVAELEVSVHTADGRSVARELRTKTVRHDGGVHGTVGIVGAVDRPTATPEPASATAFEGAATVLEEADVGVFVLDDEFDVAWINETTEHYFGVDRDAVVGRDKRRLIEETIAGRLADADAFVDTVFATYGDNTFAERFECHVTPGPDREARWLEHRSRPIESGPYAGGRVELYYDVTDRHERTAQLQRLHDAVQEWIGGDSREAVAAAASRHIQEILDLEVNGVFLYDPATEELRPAGWSSTAETLFGELPTFEAGDAIAWRVFEAGEPALIDDVTADPDVYNSETPIRTELCLPIGDHGVVLVGSPERDAFDESDRSLANVVASSLEATFDRIHHERQLERERTQTERLLQMAPIGISVENAAGETVLTNRRIQTRFGPETEAALGETELIERWDVFDASGEPLEPEDGPSARVRRTGEPVFDTELVVESTAGDRGWISVNAVPVFGPDGSLERVISSAEDVTAFKEQQRRLERRKSELETELSEVFGRVSDAFYAVDEEFRFTHVNERAEELLGYSSDELVGEVLWEVFPGGKRSDLYERYHQAMETQESLSWERYSRTLDIWMEIRAYPSPTGLSVYFRDVTERRKYEHKLEESNERLEQFAYAASHDLQEPLRMVTSYLRLIERRYDDVLDEDGREFIEFAVDGADRMREMIDGLLAYSRVETRGDEFEPVDLAQTLAAVRRDLELQIEESNAEITVESLPRVQGDRSQLRQVFQNLLTNAIEYSGNDRPRITVTAERVDDPTAIDRRTALAARGEDAWVVSVSDDGIGIDPDDHERIFEVFQRLHGHDDHDGTGIGLALCQRIVERHGGEIQVDSKPGEGATFSVTLPAAST